MSRTRRILTGLKGRLSVAEWRDACARSRLGRILAGLKGRLSEYWLVPACLVALLAIIALITRYDPQTPMTTLNFFNGTL